mmetsp:Transcript_39291/g.34993  ORF Transcript_39291/g.34993 Transcript_39291/m.34993 type:complete len:203 (-) Transcript_39291:487-1095(-)
MFNFFCLLFAKAIQSFIFIDQESNLVFEFLVDLSDTLKFIDSLDELISLSSLIVDNAVQSFNFLVEELILILEIAIVRELLLEFKALILPSLNLLHVVFDELIESLVFTNQQSNLIFQRLISLSGFFHLTGSLIGSSLLFIQEIGQSLNLLHGDSVAVLELIDHSIGSFQFKKLSSQSIDFLVLITQGRVQSLDLVAQGLDI